jgi:NDP-hexose-3-ketoreductase
MSTKKIGIGVMGCASIAERLVIPAILEQNERFELRAIASRSPEKAAYFAEKFNTTGLAGYEELLAEESIELIYMPLPTGMHEEWMMRCLDAGKHILAEKSLANDFPSAERIMAKAAEKNLLVMEDFMYRYHKQHQYTFSLLQEKALGDLRLLRSSFGFPPLDEGNFRYEGSLGGGALLDAGAYTANVSQWFLGTELSVCHSTLYIDKRKNIDILGNATLINPEGIIAQISFGFDNFYQCNYEIWGSKGFIKAEKAFTPKPSEKPLIVFNNPHKTVRFESEPDNHFYNILSEVHRSIIENEHVTHRNIILAQAKLLNQIREKATLIYL